MTSSSSSTKGEGPLQIRALSDVDREGWLNLWAQYQAFYEAKIPAHATDISWERFADPSEPMQAIGAFRAGKLLGFAHLIFHRSSWSESDYCYLQDLFTRSDHRGKGVGRALLEAAAAIAWRNKASRFYWLTHESNARAIQLYDQVGARTGFVQYRAERRQGPGVLCM